MARRGILRSNGDTEHVFRKSSSSGRRGQTALAMLAVQTGGAKRWLEVEDFPKAERKKKEKEEGEKTHPRTLPAGGATTAGDPLCPSTKAGTGHYRHDTLQVPSPPRAAAPEMNTDYTWCHLQKIRVGFHPKHFVGHSIPPDTTQQLEKFTESKKVGLEEATK